MMFRDLLIGVLGFVLGAPEPAPDAPPARWYSGAEWVLDADGNVLASSAVLLERGVDVPHGRHVRHLLRQTPGPELARDERADTTLVTLAPASAPWRLEAKGARADVEETVRGGMLALRVVYRDACGHVVRVHVVDATPVSVDDYARGFEAQFPN